MIRRFLLITVCLVCILSISGVYATWYYTHLPPTPDDQPISIGLSVFDYPPEQILPGGDTEQADPGENHMKLIDLILNESNKGYGLNYSNNVVLHSYLKKQKVVYSNQKVSGGNLKFILDTKNNTYGLYYCVEKVSDTEYYAYTFGTDELLTASGTTIYIVAYRTTLVKTDKWRATTSYLGYAQTKSLSNLGESADPNTIAYSIDVTSWRINQI